VDCAIDPARCNSHEKRSVEHIVSSIRDTHAAWVRVREGRPQQLQAELQRIDAAAAAAVEAIRQEAAELKQQLQRLCVDDVEGCIQEQSQLLSDVQAAAASLDAAFANSDAAKCLLAAATRPPLLPPPGAVGGRFEAVACESVRKPLLGRITRAGECGMRGRAAGVRAAGPGFQRAIGSPGSGPGQFQNPVSLAFDGEGNLVVSDHGNHRIQVLRYSDGAHLRTIGCQGSGNGQFSNPWGIAFDGSGHILVADHGNHRVQMLRYSDGAHVRTVGSQGSGSGQFINPTDVAVDGDGRVVVCDCSNHRLQVIE
jgi:hypothetical protein